MQHRNTVRRFAIWTRSHVSSDVSSTDWSSSATIPALLNSTSIRPSSPWTRSYSAETAASSVRSALKASSPTEWATTSTPTTRAPSRANTSALAPPIPPAAPVITHTLPDRRTGRDYRSDGAAGAIPAASSLPASASSIVRTGPVNEWRAESAYQIVTASITAIVTSGA